MKICLLSYRGNPYSGGQGIYLKYVAEELARQGNEVHAIAGPPYPDHMEGVAVHRINNHHYSVKRGFNIIDPVSPFDIFMPANFYQYLNTRVGAFSEISSFTYRAFYLLRELHSKEKFHIIHDNQSLGYGLLLMKSLGIPVVSTIHHPLTIDLQNVMERTPAFLKKARYVMFYPILMQRFVSKRLDHIITVSEDSRINITKDFGVEPEKQTVVYNGIDRRVFRAQRSGRKRRKGIIFVGNIEDGKKGFIYLLKAVTKISKDIPVTVVDGGSPHRKVTDLLIKKLGIEKRLHFTGKISVDRLVQLYWQSEIAVVPSVYEGFGFPAAEAMSCGVPVIASDGGALPEVVGDAGIIVPSRDEDSLAEAIDTLIADKERLKKFSNAGIERAAKYFSWESAVAKMIEVYKGLL